MADLLEPKTVDIELPNGGNKTFILSKFPAIAGREIITQYPLTAAPKIGDYKANEELMVKIMAYVAVVLENGNEQRLITRTLIDQHIPSWETLAKVEIGMIEYNCSFFGNGRAANFFQDIAQKALPLISKMLTGLSEQSLPKEKPPSTN